MCNFFSLLSSGDGRVYYFSPEQRIAEVKMPNGGGCFFDFHASIIGFYGLDEDKYNKWTYNPFNGKLVLDMRLTADDREAVLEEIKRIDFSFICGDIEGVREFIKRLKTMKFLDGHGDIPDGVKMFETRKEAENAARDASLGAIWDEAWRAAWDAARTAMLGAVWAASLSAAWAAAWIAARDAAWFAARDAEWDAAKDTIEVAARDAAGDSTLFVRLIYFCSDLPIDQKHIDYIKKRWSVWEAGYGVSYTVDGILYCYKEA